MKSENQCRPYVLPYGPSEIIRPGTLLQDEEGRVWAAIHNLDMLMAVSLHCVDEVQAKLLHLLNASVGIAVYNGGIDFVSSEEPAGIHRCASSTILDQIDTAIRSSSLPT